MDAYPDTFCGPERDERVAERIGAMTFAELRDACDTYRVNKGRPGYRYDRFSEWLRDQLTNEAA